MTKKEPWRIDKDSIHFKVLKGWLSQEFIGWLFGADARYNLSKTQLLTNIVETIRRITWEVFEILKEKTGKDATLPFVIISKCPTGELTTFQTVLEINNDLDILCNKSAAMRSLEIEYFIIALEEMQQMFGAMYGGSIIYGTAFKDGIAIYEQLIIDLFEYCCTETKHIFLKAVTEEAFHCFSKQTGEFRHNEITQEQRSKKSEGLTPQERWLLDSETEKKYGVEQMVNELLQILKQREDELFSLLPLNK